jgi:trk system potassium uptake protein TrkA
MNIIIIGCGKVGSKFAQILSDDGHDIVIVDNDKNAFKALRHDFKGIKIVGVPIDQDVLKQAGIENADAFAAVTPDDNVNIMACQVAKEIFKVPRVIARIYNPEREHVFHQFGLDTICPTNLTVDVIRSKILGESGSSHHTISGEAFTFKKEPVKREYEGKKLNAVKLRNESQIFGIIQNGAFGFPNQDIKLKKGDCLIIAYLTR